MAITRKVKMLISIAVIMSLYCLYLFFVKMDVCEIKYLDDYNNGHSSSHNSQSRTFLITNPPKDRFEIWDFLIQKISVFGVDEKINEHVIYNFFEEKWYLNRFFIFLYMDGNTSVYDASFEK